MLNIVLVLIATFLLSGLAGLAIFAVTQVTAKSELFRGLRDRMMQWAIDTTPTALDRDTFRCRAEAKLAAFIADLTNCAFCQTWWHAVWITTLFGYLIGPPAPIALVGYFGGVGLAKIFHDRGTKRQVKRHILTTPSRGDMPFERLWSVFNDVPDADDYYPQDTRLTEKGFTEAETKLDLSTHNHPWPQRLASESAGDTETVSLPHGDVNAEACHRVLEDGSAQLTQHKPVITGVDVERLQKSLYHLAKPEATVDVSSFYRPYVPCEPQAVGSDTTQELPPVEKQFYILSAYHTKGSDQNLTWWRKGGGYCWALDLAEVIDEKTAATYANDNRNIPIEVNLARSKGGLVVEFSQYKNLGVTREQMEDGRNA